MITDTMTDQDIRQETGSIKMESYMEHAYNLAYLARKKVDDLDYTESHLRDGLICKVKKTRDAALEAEAIWLAHLND